MTNIIRIAKCVQQGFILFMFQVLPFRGMSQAGSLDSSFGIEGKVITSLGDFGIGGLLQ